MQGNVPHVRNLPDLLRATTVTPTTRARPRQLAARVAGGKAAAPELVIWPENSTDQDPRRTPTSTGRSTARSPPSTGRCWSARSCRTRCATPASCGCQGRPGRGLLKRRLVPFGEVIPFRSVPDASSPPCLEPAAGQLHARPQGRGVPGRQDPARRRHLLRGRLRRAGRAPRSRPGANLLTVQTNDADFELDGQTGETLQQLDMARIRAVEHDRAVVVASTTGVSAIIAPDGRLMAATGRGSGPSSRPGSRCAPPPRSPTGWAAGRRPC